MARSGWQFALFAVLLAVAPGMVHAEVGIIGGINVGRLTVEPDGGFELSNRTGLTVGGLLGFGLGARVAVQLEPMYRQAGAVADLATNHGAIQIEIDYVELPVLLRLSFAGGRRVNPYLVAGPSVGYLLSANEKASFIPSNEEEIKDQLKSWDVGLSAGAGLRVPMGGSTLCVEGRYTHGLTDLDDDASADDTTTSIKSRGAQILLGLTFPLGGGG